MKLLLIEDETRLSKLLCQILRKEGYVVDDITDGEIELEMALFGSYDLIVLDWRLPNVLSKMNFYNCEIKLTVLEK